ncbi:MAG: radical SAM protein [bacterium]|nr:radical SAM protein [bacterium]
MKILLVRPHSEVPSAAPPLGLLYLAAYLQQHSSHQISICDARFKEYNFDTIQSIIKDDNPDLVGITSFSLEFRETHEIAKRSKTACPDVPVIVGGPYATSDYHRVLSDDNVDVAVIGEAEKSFFQLVDVMDKGGDWKQVNEIAYRDNGAIHKTEMREFIDDLDELPYPAWDLVNLEEYFNRKGTRKRTCFNQHQMKQRVLSIFTTRGCPYHCSYCHNLFGKKLRKRSIENVIGELRLMKDKFGVEEVEIIDDIFNLDIDRAKEIFRRIIAEKFNFKFSFPNGLRTDRLDEELFELFKAGGVFRLVFAIESGTPRIQKLIRKNLDLEKAKQNIALAAKHNFSMGGFFMMGFLDETEEEIWNTINFALESQLQTGAFFIVTPFPNTEIWQQARDKGYDLSADYENYQKVSANISKVPSKRLEKLRQIAFRRFYLNPWRLYSFMKTTPWRDRIFEKIWILIAASFFKYEK